MNFSTWNLIWIIPLALVLLYLVARIFFGAVFISYWWSKVWWQREVLKQMKKDEEEKKKALKNSQRNHPNYS